MRIFDNFLYKVVALLVAALLWAAAQGVRDAEDSFDLQVAIEDVPDDLVVVEQSAQEVNLRLQGSRAALRQAEQTLARYPISLKGVKPGEASFAVTTEGLSLPRGAYIIARSPSMLVFRTEQIDTKKVPVRADIVGKPPEGLRLFSVHVDPAQVALAGARNSVRKVREVLTDQLDISRLRETTTLDSSLISPGLPHVRINDGSPTTVRVRLVIESQKPLPGGGAE